MLDQAHLQERLRLADAPGQIFESMTFPTHGEVEMTKYSSI